MNSGTARKRAAAKEICFGDELNYKAYVLGTARKRAAAKEMFLGTTRITKNMFWDRAQAGGR